MLTNQNISEYENNIIQWHSDYDVKHEEYLKEINTLLKEKTTEAKDKLRINFINLPQSEYAKYDDIAYMCIIMCIYNMEIKNKIKVNILEHGSTVDELIKYYLKLKFQLWRLEFNYNDGSVIEFINFIEKYEISEFAISYAIIYSSANIANMIIKVSKIFLQNKALIYAYNILTHGVSLYPNNEEILFMIYNLCVKFGKADMAEHYLKKLSINSEERVE